MAEGLVRRDHLEIFRRMQTIRRFEEVAEDAFKRGEFLGVCHSAIGEEAVCAGACYALNADDPMMGTHRGHGHVIAKGADIRPLLAEIYGKRTGSCRGKAGSMHLSDLSVGALGECGVLASHMPAAVGVALAIKRRGGREVCLVFFGDGAAQEGIVHEAMNLASLWKVPVVFLCENNGYFNYVRTRERCSVPQFVVRAAAYNMPGVSVDGQDVLAVYHAVRDAVDRARQGDGPTLVEAMTYRYRAHAFMVSVGGEPEERPKEELDYWFGRDPIKLYRQRLLTEEWASESDLVQIEQQVEAAVRDAQVYARESPNPDPEELFRDTYIDPSPLTSYLSRWGIEI